jgi:hypothetical protein
MKTELTQAEKARKMLHGVSQLEDELNDEGKTAEATQLVEAFRDLPEDSAARMFDIITAIK